MASECLYGWWCHLGAGFAESRQDWGAKSSTWTPSVKCPGDTRRHWPAGSWIGERARGGVGQHTAVSIASWLNTEHRKPGRVPTSPGGKGRGPRARLSRNAPKARRPLGRVWGAGGGLGQPDIHSPAPSCWPPRLQHCSCPEAPLAPNPLLAGPPYFPAGATTTSPLPIPDRLLGRPHSSTSVSGNAVPGPFSSITDPGRCGSMSSELGTTVRDSPQLLPGRGEPQS